MRGFRIAHLTDCIPFLDRICRRFRNSLQENAMLAIKGWSKSVPITESIMIRTRILPIVLAVALSGLLAAQEQTQKTDLGPRWQFAYAQTATRLVPLVPQDSLRGDRECSAQKSLPARRLNQPQRYVLLASG